jgi:hypothetical protein
VLLLVCANECFSSSHAVPLGGAVVQARVALALWQRQQQDQEAHVDQEPQSYGLCADGLQPAVYVLPLSECVTNHVCRRWLIVRL